MTYPEYFESDKSIVLKLSLLEEPAEETFNSPFAFANVNFQGVNPSSTTSVIVKVEEAGPVTTHFVSGGSANITCAKESEHMPRTKEAKNFTFFTDTSSYEIIFLYYTPPPCEKSIVKFANTIVMFARIRFL
jgi:hypothetical protein